jgi:hypothetical protein
MENGIDMTLKFSVKKIIFIVFEDVVNGQLNISLKKLFTTYLIKEYKVHLINRTKSYFHRNERGNGYAIKYFSQKVVCIVIKYLINKQLNISLKKLFTKF